MAKDTSEKILEEMIDLAAESIKVTAAMKLPRSIVDQLTRSISSIGANFAEVQDASSKKDFLNKIYIAKKEANESVYWPKLIKKLQGDSDELRDLVQKTHKYVMMLQKIINTSKNGNR